jgi:hypothetical protein
MSTQLPERPCARQAKLTNDELEFLEDLTALAVGIIRDVKQLSFWIDDPDEYEIGMGIMHQALRMRSQVIKWKAKRRGEQPAARKGRNHVASNE